MKFSWQFLRSPLGMAAVAIAVVVAIMTFELVRVSTILAAARDEARAEATARLRAEGYLVEAQKSERQLRRSAEELTEQLAALEGKVGRVKVKEVVRWKTEEIPVVRETVTEIPCPDGSTVQAVCPEVSVEVTGATARAETKDGVVVVLGDVEVTRLSPPPKETWTRPFTAETAEASAQAPPYRDPRWMVGPLVGVGSDGFQGGVAVLGPPLKLWGVQARPNALVMATGSGQPTIAGGVVIGWGKRR